MAHVLTYEDGYRNGVFDATGPLSKTEVAIYDLHHVSCQLSMYNALNEERRGKLLTRKVTKWFDVFRQGDSFNMSTCLWDSKAAAENDPSPYRIGTYPIEIEVPQKPLTKKVTKWVNVHVADGELESSGTLYASKIEAEMRDGRTRYTPKHVGTFPLEIEVPL
jgi:hypothetical protein